MNDRLKRKLYEAFQLDRTPITFESITDKQWKQMQNTFVSGSCTLVAALEDTTAAILRFSSFAAQER